MDQAIATVQQSYIDLRGLNLGMGFVRGNNLLPGQKYSMAIEGLDDTDIEGTLDKSGFIGGLSRLYREFDLEVGDQVLVTYDDPVIRLTPPADRRRTAAPPSGPGPETTASDTRPVFERQQLRHVHIEPFAPGNLERWVPQTEADVYMVFGALSEYTDFKYCCGASKALLAKLGYSAETKPDSILIERATGQYLVAEFKMTSKEFGLNHKPEEIDVLVCWDDEELDRAKLPRNVLGLRALLEKAVKQGDIDL